MKWSARVVMHMDVKSGQLGRMVYLGVMHMDVRSPQLGRMVCLGVMHNMHLVTFQNI